MNGWFTERLEGRSVDDKKKKKRKGKQGCVQKDHVIAWCYLLRWGVNGGLHVCVNTTKSQDTWHLELHWDEPIAGPAYRFPLPGQTLVVLSALLTNASQIKQRLGGCTVTCLRMFTTPPISSAWWNANLYYLAVFEVIGLRSCLCDVTLKGRHVVDFVSDEVAWSKEMCVLRHGNLLNSN